ncbi:hypothetical protein MLD38_016006 [Melastoma candidum]|uniref:Uncharacterized protein n=1 Tax=Melastoma candidum TaxID=119954 RepID=A0ACB9RJB3_9MYRT|nr:hypothetical protein MLD38_016006 [Melastoma candidum]
MGGYMESTGGMPPGFRFFPTEEELVAYYLMSKIRPQQDESLSQLINRIIPVVDIYEFNPWDLPQLSGDLCRGDSEEWFFFIPRQESEARGGRPRRLTTSGYWKATGSPGHVFSLGSSRIIGFKRTMVFYTGRAPTGVKTEWKMNEYKAVEAEASPSNPPNLPEPRQEFSLCRVYKKSKCLRAFDRRPQLVQMANNPSPSIDGGEQPMVAAASESQAKSGMADYSSSGDDRQDNNVPVEVRESSLDESFVDWDQLDWFDSK